MYDNVFLSILTHFNETAKILIKLLKGSYHKKDKPGPSYIFTLFKIS